MGLVRIEKVRPKDTTKANALEQWLIAVEKAFGERILPVDRAVAKNGDGSGPPSRCPLSTVFSRQPLKSIA